MLSAATSWMVLNLVLGDDPFFHVAAIGWYIPENLAFTQDWEWLAGWFLCLWDPTKPFEV